MATWPTCGQSGYITPAALGVRNAYCGGKNRKWLRGPHVGKVATSPLPPWGSRALGAGTKIITGYVGELRAKGLHHPCGLEGPHRSLRGRKSEMAMWPTCGQSGYIAPTVLGVGNAHRARQNAQWLRSPHVGRVATSPVPSSGSPTLSAGTKIKNSYVARMRAKWLHHPCRLGDAQRSAREQKSEMAMWLTCG